MNGADSSAVRIDPRKLIQRIQNARLNLLREKPFFALMLMHMKFSVDLSAETAYTDGERIFFGPGFVGTISDSELEFVLMHEIMHVVLMHVFRHRDSYDADTFDYACDIAVNSNILYSCGGDLSKITLRKYGTSMHLAPNGAEGYKYTAEELYAMLQPVFPEYQKKLREEAEKSTQSSGKGGAGGQKQKPGQSDQNNECEPGCENSRPGQFDSHGKWSPENSDLQRDVWMQRLMNATDIIDGMQKMNVYGSSGNGVPPAIQRIVSEYTNPQTDWRTVLCDFVQEEVTDYSFAPPDRRFAETDFFLPDFNETSDSVKNILFMADTSGSIDNDMITQAFSEIRGAIEQFGGRLEGYLGFFDDHICEPLPFDSVDKLEKIRPVGGRGTDFGIIFDYVANEWPKKHDEPPVSIVILTDGYADFPPESAACGIPVLWLLNNDKITPPWGKSVRVQVGKKA